MKIYMPKGLTNLKHEKGIKVLGIFLDRSSQVPFGPAISFEFTTPFLYRNLTQLLKSSVGEALSSNLLARLLLKDRLLMGFIMLCLEL